MGIADSRGTIKITCRHISSLGLKMHPLWTFYNQKQGVIFEDFLSTFGNSKSWNANYNPWHFRQNLKLRFFHWHHCCTCIYRNSLQSLHSSMPCALFHTQIPLRRNLSRLSGSKSGCTFLHRRCSWPWPGFHKNQSLQKPFCFCRPRLQLYAWRDCQAKSNAEKRSKPPLRRFRGKRPWLSKVAKPPGLSALASWAFNVAIWRCGFKWFKGSY